MGLRRRRKKLTSVITNVDKRLKAVEFRHVPTRIKAASITTEEIVDGTIPPEDPKDSGATGSTSSETAPSEFATLVSAAYSSRIITGSVDRVDIVTTQPHGFAVGDKVTIYGVNNSDVDLSGTYKVTEVPSTTEFRYTRGLTGPYPTVINPVIKYAITSKMATLTEAGLILTGVGPAGHGFKQGEAITISGVGEPFDGTFLITDISDDHIYYKFATPIAASISWTSATGYANATVHKYAIVGDTWIDTSVTPSVVKVWSGLAWVSPSELPEGVIVNDHMAPKAPTNLRAVMRGYYSTDGTPKVQATLSWDAPTENADGSALTDLGGYKVFHKVLQEVEETTPAAEGGEDTTTPATDGSITGTVSYFNETGSPVTVTLSTNVGTIYPTSFNIRAGNQYMSGSHAWTVSGLTNTDSATISWSTIPSAGSGSITGSINSTSVVKNSVPGDLNGDIAITGRTQTSDTAVTPPETPTIVEEQWESDADTIETSTIIRDLPMGSDVMFMVQAYDSSKLNLSTGGGDLTVNTGKPSQALFTPSKPSLEARLGTLTVTWDGQDATNNTPPPQLGYVEVYLGTASNFVIGPDNYKGRIEPGEGGYLILSDLAYGSTWYAKLAFVSKTGVATTASAVSDPATIVALVNTDLIANTLTTWPFQNGTVDINALASGSVDATKLVANAVTQNAIAANAIGAAQIIAGSIGAGKIAANAITAGTIAANAITAGNIQANAIEADKIKAGALDAFVITGAQIQTAKSAAEGGQNSRIVLTSSGLTSYDTSGTQTFNINSSTGVVTIGAYDTKITAANNTATSASTTANTANSSVTTLASNVYYPGTTTINGGNIRTGTITATQISSSYVYAGYIDAEKINAGTITGVSISGGSLATTGTTNITISGTTMTFAYSGSSVGTMTGSYNASSGKNGIIVTTNLFALLGPGSSNPEVGIYGTSNSSSGTLNLSYCRIYNPSLGGNTMDPNGDLHATTYYGPGTANGSFKAGDDTSGNYFLTSSSYARTYSGAANAYVTANGVIGRSTSASKYKLLIEEKTNFDFSKILQLRPKTWIDKAASEGYADYLTLITNNQPTPELVDIDALDRHTGLIAEDLVDAGLEDFVTWGAYKEDGTREPEGIQYDRLWVCLLPIVNDLRDRLALLEHPE